jgi:hypothetical protein
VAQQILYTMQFKGRAVPANDAGTVLKATTTAPSCTITTVVGATGVSGNLQPTAGGQGCFESQVTFTGKRPFRKKAPSRSATTNTASTSAQSGKGILARVRTPD